MARTCRHAPQAAAGDIQLGGESMLADLGPAGLTDSVKLEVCCQLMLGTTSCIPRAVTNYIPPP
jgi:hypothetical protein